MTNDALSFQHTKTVSADLSDFHKLISKSKPREIHYRNYKIFKSLKFNVDLKNVFAHEKIKSCIKFDKVFMKVLNRHVPLKKKKRLRANHLSYTSKTLRKVIMRRSYLEKKFFLKNTDEYLRACKKQKNYCSGLYKKERETFFNGLNPSLLLIISYFGKR